MKKIILNDDDSTLQQRNRALYDSDYGCYVEEYFQELLTFERRRSERSGRPFLVMTLDFTGIPDWRADVNPSCGR